MAEMLNAAVGAGNAAVGAGLTCWDRSANYRRYIKSLGDNLIALESKMADLRCAYDNANRLVSTAEEGEGWIRTPITDGWLQKVETHRKEVEEILVKGKEMMGMTCLCGLCFSNCRARYKQSKLANEKRAEIEKTLGQGGNFKVKEDVAYEPADLILKRSIAALRHKTSELYDVFQTVKQRVKQDEGKHLVPTPEVGGWLERAQLLLEKEVQKILGQWTHEMEKGFQGVGGDSRSQSQRNSASYYQLSKHVEEKRVTVEEELRKASSFTVFTYKPANLILMKSLEALRRKTSELHDVFENVKQRVKLEEGKHLVRTHDVGGWLERVQLLLEKEVREILEQGAQEMEKGVQGVGRDSLSVSKELHIIL
ncbi:hypothetical protein CRG98_034669 [Punica granatum]|uniref:Uncharacterized protein n=1 Tax=Punica granatum TaxID=22663 RepID=A0A2I0ILQ2_PUNGR|nr:hypothetical protein CRG98_034669 [Punica granatum]